MNFLEKIFQTENLVTRILSVLIACGLWAYVMMEQNPVIDRYYQVPLAKNNVANSMVVFNAPDTVTVQVRGSRLLLDNEADKAISAYIDLKDVALGQHKLAISADFRKGDVVNVLPKEVNVLVDTIVEKTMPVVTTVVDNDDEDITIDNNGVTPDKVTVKAASTILNQIEKVVAPVNIRGQRENFKADSILEALDREGNRLHEVQITPDKAVVDAVIVRKIVNLDVPIRVVVTGEMADGFNITKAYALPEKVRITAPPSVAKELKEITTKPIDITSLVASTAVNAELDFPENVSGQKQSVKVHFVIERL